MKILYIAPDLTDSGGISRIVSLKANYLVSELNYEVDIIASNVRETSFFYDFNSKIKWHNSIEFQKSVLFLWKYIAFIKKIISERTPDIVIVCDAPHWMLIPWFLKNKIPIVLETHFSTSFKRIKNKGLLSALRFKMVYFLKKKTLNKFSKTIYETHNGRKEWNAKNSEVISNPISFVVENKADLKNKKAIAVCRHSYEKGLDRLLLIWKEIIKKHPDWQLDVYGDWDNSMIYHKMANELQISDNVNFNGLTRDIKSCFEQSSIFLMASRTEAFGMVLIEAMTCGLPSVVYDCPVGPRAIINQEVNGFLIEDGNSDSFVQKIELLIEDENLRSQMGRNASESTAIYALPIIMKKWQNLFESLL